jgi:2-dehydropantoate 2-reductase
LRRFERVYGMCVWMPALHLEPGVVEARGVPLSGVLHVGRYPHGADDFIRDVAADLEKSYFRAPVSEDVMRWKYAKLLTNLVNAIEALTGRVESEEARDLLARARAEGAAVLDAAGIGHATDEEQAPYRALVRSERPKAGSDRAGGSSWQSLERGVGSIEVDYLNGEIVLLGRLHGVPTPINEALQCLSAAHAREHRAPGSLTVAAVLAGRAGR